jgi:hypothetical protein
MNFDDNFRRVGSANIELIKGMLGELQAGDWENQEARRQLDEAYRNAQAILLVYDSDLRHVDPTRHPALAVFEPVIRPILGVTADHFDQSPKGMELTRKFGLGYFIRAYFQRLNPGGSIAEHRDKNFSLAHAHRIHVPIITNDRVWITVGGEILSIPEGEIYEINNRRPHSVRNDSTEPCVHLILDYVLKGEMCCCGEKRHPDEPCTPEACGDTVTGQVPCTCYE